MGAADERFDQITGVEFVAEDSVAHFFEGVHMRSDSEGSKRLGTGSGCVRTSSFGFGEDCGADGFFIASDQIDTDHEIDEASDEGVSEPEEA